MKKGVRSDRSSTEETGDTDKNVEVFFGRDRVGQDQESASEGQYILNELKMKTDKD